MNSVEWRIVGEGKVERGHEDREKAMLSRRQCQMGSLVGAAHLSNDKASVV